MWLILERNLSAVYEAAHRMKYKARDPGLEMNKNQDKDKGRDKAVEIILVQQWHLQVNMLHIFLFFLFPWINIHVIGERI